MTKQTRNINNTFEQVSQSLKRFKEVCAKNGSPLGAVAYKVLDNEETRTRVTYKRITKPKK